MRKAKGIGVSDAEGTQRPQRRRRGHREDAEGRGNWRFRCLKGHRGRREGAEGTEKTRKAEGIGVSDA